MLRVLREVWFSVVLLGGSLLGVPMRPEDIAEMMASMNRTCAVLQVEESEDEDDD